MASGAADRVLARLDELYRIGGGPGANRPGMSREEEVACELAAGWMSEAGLEVRRDPAGNVLGRLPGFQPELAEVWTGSHLDTVPCGGRFDGALGVVLATEAVSRIASGPRPRRTICSVVFRDEEGVRFGGGCFGSRALCGVLEPAELDKRDATGTSLGHALAQLGLEQPPGGGWVGSVGFFVEAHIEQGPRLEALDAPLAVVSRIAGTSGTRVVFLGRAGHAGTTPMDCRRDSFAAACDFAVEVRAIAAGEKDTVATIGQISVQPGAANVIPERTALTVDARAPDRPRLERLLESIERAAENRAAQHGCTVDTSRAWLYEPVQMAHRPVAALRRSLEALGCPPIELVSGAGHDAMVLASAGVPAGMLFVRSRDGGVSHSPDERTDAADVALALDVLTGALRELAEMEPP